MVQKTGVLLPPTMCGGSQVGVSLVYLVIDLVRCTLVSQHLMIGAVVLMWPDILHLRRGLGVYLPASVGLVGPGVERLLLLLQVILEGWGLLVVVLEGARRWGLLLLVLPLEQLLGTRKLRMLLHLT